MKNFVILQHDAPVGKAFDFMVHKDFLNDKDVLEIKEHGYKVDCNYAKKFIEENKNHVYVGSEDNGHIPSFNWIEEWVEDKLSDNKYEIIVLNEDFVNATDSVVGSKK